MTKELYKQTRRKKTCIYAATSFYVAGKDYPVYVDQAGKEYTKGKDGMYDLVGKTSSKFVDKTYSTAMVNTKEHDDGA